MIISAPAKLNRFLAIIGKRHDGYHNLELITTVLEGVLGLTDTLEAESDSKTSLEINGPQSAELAADDNNLVLRAWRSLELTVNRSLPAKIKLYKRIPHGAGLGGGSSDAAAALKLCNKLFKLALTTSQLLTIGSTLGSDVPLFILGGTVLGIDRGDRVFPLIDLPLEPMLIIYPNLHLETAKVYEAITKVGYQNTAPCSSFARNMTPPWRNDLTEAAIWTCPLLNEVRREILNSNGEPLLCGSGSCWAARYHDNHSRDNAYKLIMELHPNWHAWKIGS
jgi:4-diphosphocytidyl-2-C-methyl-D-erythritol kinase